MANGSTEEWVRRVEGQLEDFKKTVFDDLKVLQTQGNQLREDQAVGMKNVEACVMRTELKLETIGELLHSMKEALEANDNDIRALDKRMQTIEHTMAEFPQPKDLSVRLAMAEDQVSRWKKGMWFLGTIVGGVLIKMILDVAMASGG